MLTKRRANDRGRIPIGEGAQSQRAQDQYCVSIELLSPQNTLFVSTTKSCDVSQTHVDRISVRSCKEVVYPSYVTEEESTFMKPGT
jgi:hypothetical protein